MEADLILKGGTLICMDPQRSVRQADLVISGGRIAAIESATRQKARRVLDVRGAVVLPGFVQCRTRLGMSFFRYPEEPASRDRQRRLAALEAGHDRASAFSSAALGVAELLRSGECNVSETAAHFGFSDPNYFTRRFRQFHGVSPLEFRRKAASGNGVRASRS